MTQALPLYYLWIIIILAVPFLVAFLPIYMIIRTIKAGYSHWIPMKAFINEGEAPTRVPMNLRWWFYQLLFFPVEIIGAFMLSPFAWYRGILKIKHATRPFFGERKRDLAFMAEIEEAIGARTETLTEKDGRA